MKRQKIKVAGSPQASSGTFSPSGVAPVAIAEDSDTLDLKFQGVAQSSSLASAPYQSNGPSTEAAAEVNWVNNRLNQLHADVLRFIAQNNTAILGLIDANAASLTDLISKNNQGLVETFSESGCEISRLREAIRALSEEVMSPISALRGEGISGAQLEEMSANVVTMIECLSASLLGIIGQNSESISKQTGEQLQALSIEFHQKLHELRTELSSAVLAIIADNSASLSAMLGKHFLDISVELDRREQLFLEAMLRRSAAVVSAPPSVPTEAPAPVNPLSLDEAMERLRALASLNFDVYLMCLNTGTASYDGLPAESCSTERHPQALLFRDFLKPYLKGHVLDVGCGPQSVPSYLSEWPIKQITGLDPISKASDHPFQFVSGVGEFIPFHDESFGTVISGTTLDHYYLLDLGLKEAYRVLQPGGHFVAWITEFRGAPAYDPYSGPMKAYDSEHMYHIDRAWFMPLMEEIGFEEVETICLPQPFRYLFMSFRKPGIRRRRKPSFVNRLCQLFIRER